MTFSIAASDPESEKMGIAISTAFIAVGAICPFVSENAAVSSQSFDSGRNYGERTINVVDEGFSVSGAAGLVVEESDSSPYTQLHGIDADGDQFTHTGDDCDDWAGHDSGDGYTVEGAISGDEQVVAVGRQLGVRFGQRLAGVGSPRDGPVACTATDLSSVACQCGTGPTDREAGSARPPERAEEAAAFHGTSGRRIV
jgi:hypothetical protein